METSTKQKGLKYHYFYWATGILRILFSIAAIVQEKEIVTQEFLFSLKDTDALKMRLLVGAEYCYYSIVIVATVVVMIGLLYRSKTGWTTVLGLNIFGLVYRCYFLIITMTLLKEFYPKSSNIAILLLMCFYYVTIVYYLKRKDLFSSPCAK